MRYRVTFIPRARGPFADRVVAETPELPRFEGGAVILTQPLDLDERQPSVRPAFMAWPLDMMSAVVVDRLDDAQ